jgi:predicted transcriptional regulator of viral defense system
MAVGVALARLADLAEAQDGLVTTRQAEARNVARRDLVRLAQVGGIERVAHGVYRIGGAPRVRLIELKAAWLQLAPGLAAEMRTPADGVVSHDSAAVLYGAGLLEPFSHEFSVPRPRRVRSRRTDVVIHSVDLRTEDVAWAEGLLVTTPTRTVADLCLSVLDGEHLAGVVADLLHRGMASEEDLARSLAEGAGRYGFADADGRTFLDYLLGFSA